ncbi:MAG: class I SAM-dependent methyltransferase [Chitinispirillaceae bacterium]|nr:class I SAM-dependent methyltransferase [Chitinispirillaceae bacterium]
MTRTGIVQAAIDAVTARRYLEIGVARGANFLRVKAPVKVAVDPFMAVPFSWIVKRVVRNPSNILNRYVRTTSDRFFQNLPGRRAFDVIFIDGLHTYEQSLRDVDNSLRHLSPKGIILLHDCNPPRSDSAAEHPPERETATIPWCGEVWKTIVHLRAISRDRSVQVIDCDLGVGILVPVPPRERLPMNPATIPSLTYDDLEANRAAWLNLTPPEALAEILAGMDLTA